MTRNKKIIKNILIIPAYNEEKQISEVLKAALGAKLIDKIIVINDGSKDKTAEIISRYPVTLINHKKNHGKGAALQSGINLALNYQPEIIIFLDADLIGLKPYHLDSLVEPLLKDDKLIMTVGLLKRGDEKITTPEYSGQRAIKVSFFDHCFNFSKLGFGVELAITDRLKKIAKKRKISISKLRKEIFFEGVTHITKEKKHGPIPGFGARIKMYSEIGFTPLHIIKADLEKFINDLDKIISELEEKRMANKNEQKIDKMRKKLNQIKLKWHQKLTKNLS